MKNYHLYNQLGARINKEGCDFAVWAPHASYVSVIGDFNHWDPGYHPLSLTDNGIWHGSIQGAKVGQKYKYHIVGQQGHYRVDKGDPFALYWEIPPENASIIWDLNYEWRDSQWMEERKIKNSLTAPMTIYEVHLPSWRRVPEEGDRSLSYLELALYLPSYVNELGFTHVEFLPIMEHPFYDSWGYQTVGYFAPSSRYGTPQEFMQLIDALHQQGIGVILDWVPSHFPVDSYGLSFFDGTHLYEYGDPKKGMQPDWQTLVFDYSKQGVRDFLGSSALFWLEKYHVDALRMDAIASMLYLDYSRKPGEWEPNIFGGKENLEAIDFLRSLNTEIYAEFPYVQTIAEESTAWPMVSRPTYLGGLGFGMKWNMGWMHDILHYMSFDPLYRKYHHNRLLFSLHYAFSENYLLCFSHDEVVYGKGSLIQKMPGDIWQKFANVRLLLGFLYTHPGKKLLFMGSEFGQWSEWNHHRSLDWHLLENKEAFHVGLQSWVQDLNHLLSLSPALYEKDFTSDGFEWIDTHDWEQSIISFIRKGCNPREQVLIVCNFTPVPRLQYRIGVPFAGFWKELLNSDALQYAGSGLGNFGGVQSESIVSQGRQNSLLLTLPPLAILMFGFSREEKQDYLL